MKSIKIIILSIAVVIGSTLFVSLYSAAPVSAAVSQDTQCNRGFLGFPNWYRGLTKNGTRCNLKSPADFNTSGNTDGLSVFIWHIALNIIEIGMMVVGYVTIGLMLYGGAQYLTSAGNAENAKKAKTTITNATIGLIISIVAVAVVNLILGVFK